MSEANASKIVVVTGASGFIASHIVAQLLEKGYTVRGTVRDANNKEKTAHLTSLAGAKERLSLHSADLSVEGVFDDIIPGADGVIHTATPVNFGAASGEDSIYKPGMKGLESVLQATKKAGTVKTFVLTSSMAAMAPKPAPAVKDESHWSDADEQIGRGNWYGATKTRQEQRAIQFFKEELPGVRFAAICPTMVVGPMLQPTVNATMGHFLSKFKNGMERSPNDSMSLIDVRDCAAMHVAAYEKEEATGRYMSLVESLHWNDLTALMKQHYPKMTDIPHCEGTPDAPTQFDRSRQDSLGVNVMSMSDIIRASVADFIKKGLLE